MRTRRYGAQTTRTGRVENRVVAIVLADGEIFSNLKFAQRLYDLLIADKAINSHDPVHPEVAMAAAAKLVPTLLQEDGVVQNQVLLGDALNDLLREFSTNTASEEGTKQLLASAFASSQAYHEAWLLKTKGKK